MGASSWFPHGRQVVFEAGLRAPWLVARRSSILRRVLAGPVADTQWTETFSLDANVRADSSALGDMSVLWKFENGCRVTAVPGELDPEPIPRPVHARSGGCWRRAQMLEFGPGTEHFADGQHVALSGDRALGHGRTGAFTGIAASTTELSNWRSRTTFARGSFVRGSQYAQ